MDPKFKRKMLSGLTASIGRYLELATEWFIPELPDQFRQRLDPHLPSNGQLLAMGLPLATWIPRDARVPGTKKRDYAMGASMYSLPALLKQTVVQAVAAESPAGVGDSHRMPAPYVTKKERLPFQTDISY